MLAPAKLLANMRIFWCRHIFTGELRGPSIQRSFRQFQTLPSELKSRAGPEKPSDAYDDAREDDHGEILQRWTGRVENQQQLFIIQPDYKWGKERFSTKLSHHRLAEAKGLVESVPGWNCQHSSVESIHDHHGGSFFGSGKVKELRSRIATLKQKDDVTAVLVNTGNLSKRQTVELEKEWDCRVFDRYRVVLEIFKERAHTKTAKLQVQLAELQYLRSHITSDASPRDHPRGRQTAISGSKESPADRDKRIITAKSDKINRELTKIRAQRRHAREERQQKKVPQVALLGYTNAGKTTLARALSKDSKLEPEDKLFATLDSTAHGAKLPSGMNAIFIDTVGFVSDLPHGLVGSFSATLDDVLNADLLIHVRDMSHPEQDLQKKTVFEVLDRLNVDGKLRDNMIEVQNKIDLSDTPEPFPLDADVFQVSALHNVGIDALTQGIETSIFHLTGRRPVTVIVDPGSDQLSWLHKETTVVSYDSTPDGILHVSAIMDDRTANKYKKRFGSKIM